MINILIGITTIILVAIVGLSIYFLWTDKDPFYNKYMNYASRFFRYVGYAEIAMLAVALLWCIGWAVSLCM